MFWLYDKKTESTKIRNNKIDFDIRDGLSNIQRAILFSIYDIITYDKYDDWVYENGLTPHEIKSRLKHLKLFFCFDENILEAVKNLSQTKYPILAINSKKEICITKIFDEMFNGQEGADYTFDFILSSCFPNLLCNGGIGYVPHELKNVVEAISAFVENREISDEQIHKILNDDSDKDLKKIVEAFVNHRIAVFGCLNRIEYDRWDNLSRILQYGSKEEKARIKSCLSVEEYEKLKCQQIEKLGNINNILIQELEELVKNYEINSNL